MYTQADGTVHVIKTASTHRSGLTKAVVAVGLPAVRHNCIDDFMLYEAAHQPGCIAMEVTQTHPIGLLEVLRQFGNQMPVVVISDSGDVARSVQAMKAGAADYLVSPVPSDQLLRALTYAINAHGWGFRNRYIELGDDEQVILSAILDGRSNKQIARDLRCCERTVKTRRAQLMRKCGARSIVDLVRIWMQTERGPSSFDQSDATTLRNFDSSAAATWTECPSVLTPIESDMGEGA